MPRAQVSKSAFARVVFIATVAMSCSSSAQADDVTWTGTAGDGIWNTTSANWSTGLWANNSAAADSAIFGITASPVTVTGGINAYSMNFNSSGWSLNPDATSSGSLTLVSTGTGTLGAGQISVVTGTATINVPIAGTIGMIKASTGTLVLGAASTYTGPTVVNNGVLTLAVSNALPATTDLTLGNQTTPANNGSLVLTNGITQTVNSLLIIGAAGTGNGTVRLSGSGTLVVNGPITYGPAISLLYPVTLGTLGSTTIDLGGGLRNVNVYDGSNSLDFTIAATITDGGINYTGTANGDPGSMKLTGANTFIGGFTLNSGAITLTGVGTLGGPTNPVTVNSAGAAGNGTNSTISSSVSLTIGSLSGTIDGLGATNSITLTGTTSLTINQSSFTTYAGAINTTASGVTVSGLLANGANVGLTLTGANGYTGPTTIKPSTGIGTSTVTFSGNGTALSAGALTIGTGSSVPSPTLVFDNSAVNIPTRYNTNSAITLNNGSITLIGNTAGTSQQLGGITVAANAMNNVITVTNNGTQTILTFASLTPIPNTSQLVFTGNGISTLGNGLSNITFLNSPVDLATGYIDNAFINAGSGNVQATWSAANGVYAYVPTTPPTASGTVIDNIGTASPVVTNVVYTTTGDTSVHAGATIASLILDAGNNLIFSQVNAAAVGNGGGSGNGNTPITTLTITGALITTSTSTGWLIKGDGVNTGYILNLPSAGFSIASALTIDTSVTVTGTNLTKQGAGTLTINGTNSINGAYVIEAGTLYSTAASITSFSQASTAVLTSFNAALTATGAVTVGAGSFSGTTASVGSFTQNGTATSSSFSGTLTAGSVLITNGMFSGTAITTSATTASFTQSGAAVSTTLTGALTATGGVVTISNGNFNAGSIITKTLTQNNTAGTTTVGTITLSGAVTLSAGSLSAGTTTGTGFTQNTSAISSTFSGLLTASGTAGLTVSAGTLTANAGITATNASGGITVSGGTVTAFGTVNAGTAGITVKTTGTFILGTGATNANPITLTKGKLQINGTHTTSAISVSNGAELEGTGTISSTATNVVTIPAGGLLAGGDSTTGNPNVGQLSIGNGALNFSAVGSELGVGITGGNVASANTGGSSSGSANNSVIAKSGTGTVTVNAGTIVVITATAAFTSGQPYSYTVGTGFSTATVNITSDSQFTFNDTSYTLTPGASSLTQSGGNLYLNFTPLTTAPEPGMLLGLAAALGLLAFRRR